MVAVSFALAGSALTLDKAWDIAGIRPDPHSANGAVKLRTLVHMVRCTYAHGVAEGAWRQVKVIGQKIIGMKDFESIGGDCLFWEVTRIAGDNHVAASDDGSGKNVTVVGIGNVERGDKRFVPGY